MPARKPHVGDIAHHKGALDSRPVMRVEKIGARWFVGLWIGDCSRIGEEGHGVEAWPCPASNYTYARPAVSA